ncbi:MULTISPECIES: hypothetical protein [unclassified Bacillus (in: firmicutes)]|uniref:hypothetical protein n=1 Tax=unclassified Bacillus (in: firmicutes) TaxID=185979 RepID=UPI000BF10C06|nr:MULTISPECIES: hypothetical protein [unclassified Bacillus (in: firmicutes)]PEJ59050.1 hypothetical protein CN692_06110 [Bacillus sp. AFS002410]PEK99035.1 hypothetical protein CN601_24310 [Bacillus sp. AFS017336]
MNDEFRISIYLNESDNVFASYYNTDDLHLNSELEDFIISKLQNAKQKNIKITYYGQENIDEDSLKSATFNSFSKLMKEDELVYTRNIKKTIILFVIGIIIGVFYLKLSSKHEYIGGILSIVCWVFIWSGTEVYFFDNLQIKQKIRKCRELLSANVYKKTSE